MLAKIYRKKTRQNQLKQIQLKRKFLDLSFLGEEASHIQQILKDFTSSISNHEGKLSFLELCHRELESRNNNLKQNLMQLLEQEKRLEKYLVFAFSNIEPNFLNKNGKCQLKINKLLLTFHYYFICKYNIFQIMVFYSIFFYWLIQNNFKK